MKKSLLLGIVIYLFFSISIFAQTQHSSLDAFLGKSTTTIQSIWGYPERTEINKDGLLLWYYTYMDATRIFYFYDNYVEMSHSILTVTSYEYAIQLAQDIDTKLLSDGFWNVPAQHQDQFLYTNGVIDFLGQINRYGNNYTFQLITYYTR